MLVAGAYQHNHIGTGNSGQDRNDHRHDNTEEDNHRQQATNQSNPKAGIDKNNSDRRLPRFTSETSCGEGSLALLTKSRKQQPLSWFVGKTAYVPRKIIVKSCQVLDERDSREEPGMMKEETFRDMVTRFDNVFNPGIDSTEKVSSVIEHLKKHTVRRRGAAVLNKGLIEWEQTSRIYELFSIELNIFERIYFTVDVGESQAIVPKTISFILITLIFISIITWMIGTIPGCQRIPDKDESTGAACSGNIKTGECAPEALPFFKIVERICVITFTLEYFIRLFTAHSVRKAFQKEKFLEAVLIGRSTPLRRLPSHISQETRVVQSSPKIADEKYPDKLDGMVKNTLFHLIGFANIIDLLAIIPFWLETFEIQGGGGFLVVLRVLRLTRIFRIFKVGKYNDMFTLFSRVVTSSVEALGLMIFFMILACCLFGTLIWFAEQGEWYPEGNPTLATYGIVGRGAYLRHLGTKSDDDLEESPFQSIVHSTWYVIVTITTVGYGDYFPKTPAGQVVGSVTILTGIIVLAMPIGVVGANFSKEYYDLIEDKKRRKRMQQQLEAQEHAEEEQDAALMAEGGAIASLTEVDESVGKEIVRTDRKREELLQKAEAIDDWWKLKFSEAAHRELSEQLRFFVVGFVDADEKDGMGAQSDAGSTGVGMAKPRVHLTQLWELDALTTMVYKTISSMTSVDELEEFRLKEAHEARDQWNKFTSSCWDYAMNYCRVEKRPSAPEYFAMKANIASRPARVRSTFRYSRSHEAFSSQTSGKSRKSFDHILQSSPEEPGEESKLPQPSPPISNPPALQPISNVKKQAESGAGELPGVVGSSSLESDTCERSVTD